MRAYLAFVGLTLRWRWTTLAITIALFIFSLSLARHIPSSFMPDDDIDQTRVSIELTPDATLEDTLAVSEAARLAIADVPGVKHIFSSVGRLAGDIGSSGGKSRNNADLNLVLEPRGKRPDKTIIERDIEARLQHVAGARFTVGLSAGGEPGYMVSLTSDNPQILEETAQALMRDIRALPNAGSITSTKSLAREELRIYPDTLKMADRGITTLQLADTLRVATQGDYEQRLAKLNLESRQLPIIVRLPKTARATWRRWKTSPSAAATPASETLPASPSAAARQASAATSVRAKSVSPPKWAAARSASWSMPYKTRQPCKTCRRRCMPSMKARRK